MRRPRGDWRQMWRMPLKFPFALLAHVGDEDQARLGIVDRRRGFQGARDGEQGGESRAVVGDAGAVETAVGIDRDLLAGLRGDDRIEVRGEGDQRAFTGGIEERDHVAGAVDLGVAAVALELRGHPLGAAVLEEGRRGDAAQLEVLLVDPLLLAREPLQRLANSTRLRQVADLRNPQRHICRHLL